MEEKTVSSWPLCCTTHYEGGGSPPGNNGLEDVVTKGSESNACRRPSDALGWTNHPDKASLYVSSHFRMSKNEWHPYDGALQQRSLTNEEQAHGSFPDGGGSESNQLKMYHWTSSYENRKSTSPNYHSVAPYTKTTEILISHRE